MTPYDWRDRTVLITGGTRGIGLETALTFARAGARLVLTWRWGGDEDQARARFLAEGLPAPRIERADVAQAEDTERLLQAIRSDADRIDGFISNVALAARVGGLEDYRLRGLQRSIEYTSWPLAAYTLRIHEVFGSWPAYIIALSSFGTTRLSLGYDFVAASKAVLETMVRYLSWHLREHGVRVNAVTCGPARTESARDIGGDELAAFIAWHEQHLGPLQLVEPTTIAHAIFGLCSGWMDGINGQIVTVDDGRFTFAENRFGLYDTFLKQPPSGGTP